MAPYYDTKTRNNAKESVSRTLLSTETTRATANKNWNKDKDHTKSKGVTRIKNKIIRRRRRKDKKGERTIATLQALSHVTLY